MAESLREVLTISDPYKAAASYAANGFAGAKVLGHLNGRSISLNNDALFNIGAGCVYTEVGSGATAGVVQAPTATVPPVVQFTTGATQHNNQQVQFGRAQTAGSTT